MSPSRSHRKSSFRTSSSCSCSSYESKHSKSRRRSREENDDSSKKSTSSRNSKHGNALHKLTKRVHRMVNDDKQGRSASKETHVENKVVACGCPFNCGAELEELRDYVNRLLPLLESQYDKLQELECLSECPERLLLEAWTILGAQKLQALLTNDILAICARREKRDKKHRQSGAEWPLPPFSSFDELRTDAPPTCGITELWKRSLSELRQLSPEQIRWILSDSPLANSIELHWEEASLSSAEMKSARGNSVSNNERHPADSTSTTYSDHVPKNAAETEARCKVLEKEGNIS